MFGVHFAVLRQQALQLVGLLGLHAVRVVGVWEFAVTNFARIRLQGLDGDFRKLCISLGEFRLELVEHAEQVVAQQQLAAARRAGAYGEREDVDGVVNRLGDRSRNRLDLETAGTSLLDGLAVLDDAHAPRPPSCPAA